MGFGASLGFAEVFLCREDYVSVVGVAVVAGIRVNLQNGLCDGWKLATAYYSHYYSIIQKTNLSILT